MKKRIYSSILLLAVVFSLLVMPTSVMAAESAGAVFYVAVDGSNSNPGTYEAPFANIIGARDAIRELKAKSGLPKGGITVYLRGGEYDSKEEILFEEQDSGTAESPIMYKAYNNEEVVLNAGIKIDGMDFKPVTDTTMLGRLDTSVRKKVYCVNLLDYVDELPQSAGLLGDGTSADGKLDGRILVPDMEVFIGEDKYVTARYPNMRDDGIQDFLNLTTPKKDAETGLWSYNFNDATPSTWADSDNIWVTGDYPSTWGRFSCKIDLDKKTSTVNLLHKNAYSCREENRFCFTNVFEELDKAGEYYIDYETGMFYIYPKGSIRNEEVGLTYYSGEEGKYGALIKMMNASYITLSGIDITLSRSSAIYMTRGTNNKIIDCEITNIGQSGIGIGEIIHTSDGRTIRGWGLIYNAIPGQNQFGDFGEPMTKEEYKAVAGYNHAVENCSIRNVGQYGVQMCGGDRIDLEPCNYRLYNSEIINAGTGSVYAMGCGIYVGHNTIRRTPGVGIEIGGNDTIVEYNDISDTCYEGGDLGAIYSSAYDAVAHCGSEVRYNYIHDINFAPVEGDLISAVNGNGFRVGVYMDYSCNFIKVHHNIFYNIPFGTFGLGSEFDVYDNVFVDVNYPINTRYEAYINNWENVEESEAARELVYLFENSEAWRTRFPEAKEYLDWLVNDTAKDVKRQSPKNDYIGNLMVYNNNKNKYHEDGYQLDCQTQYEQNLTVENNQHLITDPGFVDIRSNNFDFKDDAKVLAQNEELGKIVHSKMGRNKDELSLKLASCVALKVGEADALTFGTSAMVDSSNANVKPVIIDSRTLVPVRFISEAFGCEVGWDADTQTVTITKDGRIVTMQIGSKTITVDGAAKEIDVPAQIIESRTMVPLRALTEALGKEVFWDDRGLIVISDEADFLNSEEDKEIIDKLVEYVTSY